MDGIAGGGGVGVIFLSLFSGGGGFDLGLERAGLKCVGQVEIMQYALKVLKKHWPQVPKHTDISTFCVQDGLAKTIQSQVSERVSKAKNLDSGKKWRDAYDSLSRIGLLEKMFQGFYPSMTEKTFARLSPSCRTSGMAFRGEYLTLDTSESPRIEEGCSLSDVLESHVHPKYYLKPKAIQGIIRRSKKWGRSGYVFLQEMVNDKTQVTRTLSLSHLEQIFGDNPISSIPKLLSPPPSELDQKQEIGFKDMWQAPSDAIETDKDQSSRFNQEILLRRLTPTEKERLQGFPIGWTLCEES